MANGATKVFVYGTLKSSGSRKGMLMYSADPEIKFLGADKLVGAYQFIDLGAFPGVVLGGKDRTINGEVYEIPGDVLNALDGIEGHPDFYERQKVSTEGGHNVWCYFLPSAYADRYPQVAGDEWRR